MKHSQWNDLAQSNAPLFKKHVMHEVRLYLSQLDESDRVTTEHLVETLYPREVADQSLQGDTARKLIYKTLAKLAHNGLEDCCEKGEVNGKYFGKDKRPWLWFSPGEVETCCMCGQVIPATE